MPFARSTASRSRHARTAAGFAVALLFTPAITAAAQPFLPQTVISSTIPGNGDLNPYGVAIVPNGFPSGGKLSPGDVLISNFNAASNLQGTGTTIVKLTPNGLVAPPVTPGQNGNAQTFFQGSPFPTLPGLGLTMALGVLRGGFVVVGAVPTPDGANVVPPGALFFIDRNGNQVGLPYTNKLDGPWGLTVFDKGSTASLFVANVLNGTVTRLDLTIGATGVTVTNAVVIASGYAFRTDPSALVVGPAGLAYSRDDDTLFVASTADNAIFAVSQAAGRTMSTGTGRTVFQDPHLHGPLALVLTPDGNLLTSNGDAINPDPTQPSELIEFTRSGRFVSQSNIDAALAGPFGAAVGSAGGDSARLAFVDDDTNDVTATLVNSSQGQQGDSRQ